MAKRRIECKISDSIVRFREILHKNENADQDVHDIIMSLQSNDSCLTEADADLVSRVLNAFLSLTFTLIKNEEEVQKFIEYYD